jgi:hypothetical protein
MPSQKTIALSCDQEKSSIKESTKEMQNTSSRIKAKRKPTKSQRMLSETIAFLGKRVAEQEGNQKTKARKMDPNNRFDALVEYDDESDDDRKHEEHHSSLQKALAILQTEGNQETNQGKASLPRESESQNTQEAGAPKETEKDALDKDEAGTTLEQPDNTPTPKSMPKNPYLKVTEQISSKESNKEEDDNKDNTHADSNPLINPPEERAYGSK